MQVKDKVFAVTGAGSGIGKAIVVNLLGRGAIVAGVDLNKDALDDLVKEVGVKSDLLSTHVLSITDKKAVEKLPEEVVKAHQHIDAVINDAGIIQPFVKINDLDYDAIEKVMNVNFYGALYMTKAFLPLLLKRPEGYVVNVSSMGGFLPVPGQSIYGASKAAVKLMTEGLYAELADTNVHVSVVFPGATNTNISKNSGVATPEVSSNKSKQQSYPTLSPEEVAEIIVSGIEDNRPQIFTGKDSKMMNLLYRLNPVYATNLIAKQMKSLLSK
ncbi:short-chain dehydrogenase [Candidatus Berkelbacteria bacterium CG10_big_fil_rev_8_21_14_0_10_43_13]|uniref:Short-chain dehydrogenase n=1 Tax=Candidatus Berkelbacteria bacterium CG10_big_fil_rev_8_21_14_0_10_43_13 TaxID=1974514 RepID=A0A2H0W5D8_9BACT|nr:MAG: short-chain dehydrogenase [Candidatus Berkelbacteria bacterium CG10_big_fil_rev_8_21_14_0_10_43_13]